MEEIFKRFVAWTKVKVQIYISERIVYFREGEIWWTNLGANIGNEQDGKDEKFMRPVLVLKKFNAYLFWAIPLSSKTKESNQYYYRYTLDSINYHSAVLSQLRALSSKRLIRKIGMFPANDYIMIREKIRRLI